MEQKTVVANAIDIISAQAKEREHSDKEAINRLLAVVSSGINADTLINSLLYNCDVTLNFHPDRISQNGKLIIDNLLSDGKYHNQFKTGVSNGGLNPYEGGQRDLWEKRLFCCAYHDGRSALADRPKYGALNIHNHIDGAAPRFGSCFFTLKPHMAGRCTFADGDSNSNPATMGTAGHFCGILLAMLQSVRDTGQLYGEGGFTVKSAVDYILSMRRGSMGALGRNLDFYIETHVHGDILLSKDVACLYLDGSYIGTYIEEAALALCKRYGISPRYIPKRQFPANRIDDEWKGPLARPLAKRIVNKFKDGVLQSLHANYRVSYSGGLSGDMLNAALLGLASQDSVINQSEWLDIGTQYDLSQNFKYLWHYIAHFGDTTFID